MKIGKIIGTKLPIPISKSDGKRVMYSIADKQRLARRVIKHSMNVALLGKSLRMRGSNISDAQLYTWIRYEKEGLFSKSNAVAVAKH